MKRISILLLTIAIALMAGNGVSAKGKVRKSSDATVPNVQSVMNQIHKLWDNSHNPQTVSGIDLLAKKYDDSGYDDNLVTAVVFGKNANIIFDEFYGCRATATSQHAFYFYCSLNDDSGIYICFKSKADRDKFWTSFKKSRNYKRGLRTFMDNGWYCVELIEGA